MDDKRLDEMLNGLRNNYERLPEYSDTRKIMDHLTEKRKKRKRFAVIPLVTVFTSFLLFFILALPTVEEYQNATYSKTRLNQYIEEKKSEFQTEIGVDEIDTFLGEEDIDGFVDSYEDPLSKEEFEEAQKFIDNYFRTPKQAMENLNENIEENRQEQWLTLNRTMDFFKYQLNNYFSQLKVKYSLDGEEQAALYENIDNYSGPIEIIEFLNLVEEQGYEVVQGNTIRHVGENTRGLGIRTDYEIVLEEIDPIEEDEAIRALLVLASERLDIQQFGTGEINNFDISWDEYDDVLLEFEEIYRSYPENRDLIRQFGMTTSALAMYMHDYISAGMAYHVDPQEGYDEELYLSEIESFIENHPDSMFRPVIATAVSDYENDRWPTGNDLHGYKMEFILNTVEEDVEYSRLYDLYEWPIMSSTRIYYTNYEQRENLDIISALDAYEFVSMYVYAASQDEKLYEALYAGEGEQANVNWQNMAKDAALLVENRVNEESIEFSFVTMENGTMQNEYLATITMEYEDGWQVVKEEVYE